VSGTTTAVAGEQLSVQFTYDLTTGLLSKIAYPDESGAFGVEYSGFDRGNATLAKSTQDETVFWQWTEADSSNRITTELLANGAMSTHRFYDDDQGGVLRTVKTTVTGSGGILQDLEYNYDAKRNLFSRVDHGGWPTPSGTLAGAQREDYCYDALDRVTGGAVNRAGSSCAPDSKYKFAYDDDGNIKSKWDVGDYTYEPSHPHAVVAAGSSGFTYDPNGNRITERRGDDDEHVGKPTIVYTALDKPSAFMKGNVWTGPSAGTDCAVAHPGPSGADACTCKDHVTESGTSERICSDDTVGLTYDGAQSRVRKTTKNEEIIYVVGFYERVKDLATGHVDHKFYIYSPQRGVGIVTRHRDDSNAEIGADDVRFLHAGHDGSTDVITDAAGTVEEKRSYDAFGARRDPDLSKNQFVIPEAVERVGFTAHEEDGELGLVNMNGRVYDPTVGRFLTADPIVQAPLSGQSWNRYSYVFNNPLTLLDPSGFQSEGSGDPEPVTVTISGGGSSSSSTGNGTQNQCPSNFPKGACGPQPNVTPSQPRQTLVASQVSTSLPVTDAAPAQPASAPRSQGLVDRYGNGPFNRAYNQIEILHARDAVQGFAGLIAATILIGPKYYEDVVTHAVKTISSFYQAAVGPGQDTVENVADGLTEAGTLGILAFPGAGEVDEVVPLAVDDANIVYRVIRPDESPALGLFAKNAAADYTVEGHVLNGSRPGWASQWISTTRDVEVAQTWAARTGNRIVTIDLSLTSSPFVDLSSAAGRAAFLRGITARNFAAASSEVLIRGSVEPAAITIFQW
jgi:RHS repeat-associated protein